jgi:uncharacterized Zn ribbon protein
MYTHPCIKCGTQYQDADPDPYYCKSCNDERKKIAKEIDAKIKAKPKRSTMSALQEYDNMPKIGGFIQVRL